MDVLLDLLADRVAETAERSAAGWAVRVRFDNDG